MILFEAVWSTLITGIAFLLSDHNAAHSFKTEFWASQISISSSIIKAVGWAVFALLGFYVKEASSRYRQAQESWNTMSHLLRQVARQFIQIFPKGTWHNDDRSRIIAHLVSYPIALKMYVRKERERAQLSGILTADDLEEVLAARSMPGHCLKVVRSYLTAIESDCDTTFFASVTTSPGSSFNRNFVNRILDAIEGKTNCIVRILDFGPSCGYVNHLRTFMYLWFLFIPFSLVEESGW